MNDEIEKNGPISQLIILNDNAGITFLAYPILCYAGPIFLVCK